MWGHILKTPPYNQLLQDIVIYLYLTSEFEDQDHCLFPWLIKVAFALKIKFTFGSPGILYLCAHQNQHLSNSLHYDLDL